MVVHPYQSQLMALDPSLNLNDLNLKGSKSFVEGTIGNLDRFSKRHFSLQLSDTFFEGARM
jgi:hypothetical protein